MGTGSEVGQVGRSTNWKVVTYEGMGFPIGVWDGLWEVVLWEMGAG